MWKTLIVLALAGAAAWGWNFRRGRGEPARTAERPIWHTVARGDFELAITERGEIDSVGDIEIRSEVKSKNTTGIAILKIVPEGTVVKKGDFLAELDSSVLQEERLLQQINVNNAEARVVEARNLYETAVIAQAEYADGTFVQERQTIESEAFVAEENLSRAQDYLKYSEKLAAKGYVNELQLEADKFAVEKSKKELDAAKTKLKVLEDYTRAKMLKQFESDKLIAKAKWDSEKNTLELELGKLKDVLDQIAKCTLTSPADGKVKFAHVRDQMGDNNFIVEEGAVVRERQTIIRLPDPSKMRVQLTINESLIQHVKPGMAAVVTPIGIAGSNLKAEVDSINQYAEPSGWRKANVKEYKAQVKILEPAPELRSGMTASVTIRSLDEPSVLQAPVQAVYAHGPAYYCFVERGEKLEAVPVQCGPTNDRFFVIESGLNEGDRIAMNPRQLLDEVSLPELPPERKQQAVPTGAPLASG